MKQLVKDPRMQFILALALFAVLAGIWYVAWYQPAQTRIQTLEREVKNLSKQRDRGLAAKRNLPKLKAKIADLEREISNFLAALPDEERFYEVLDLLTKNAEDAGVTLSSISRSPARSEIPGVGSIDVIIDIRAPFPALYDYLKALENLKRYSSMDGVTLNPSGGDPTNPEIGTKLKVHFYVYQANKPGGSP